MKKLIITSLAMLMICSCIYSRTHWHQSIVQSAIDGILKIRTIAKGEYDVDLSAAAISLGDGYVLALTHCTSADKVSMMTPFGLYEADNEVDEINFTVNGVNAELVGREGDLSLFRCAGALDAFPVPWGNSDDLRVGDRVISIGRTYGMLPILTEAMISSLDFQYPGEQEKDPVKKFVFSPGPAPGDSGSPVIAVDTWGGYRVVGIVDQAMGKLGTAIYGNYVLKAVEKIKGDAA